MIFIPYPGLSLIVHFTFFIFTPMNIQQSNHSFYIEKDGQPIAEIVYSTSFPGRLIIEHTEVDDEYEGQGIGKELVHRTVDYAKEQNLELVVRCSFAKKVLEEN